MFEHIRLAAHIDTLGCIGVAEAGTLDAARVPDKEFVTLVSERFHRSGNLLFHFRRNILGVQHECLKTACLTVSTVDDHVPFVIIDCPYRRTVCRVHLADFFPCQFTESFRIGKIHCIVKI